jgi:hypothetical protein
MSNTSSNLRPEGTILRKSTKQAPPRQSFDPLAYQMQGLAHPPQNQVPPNQAAVYQSAPARNQQNVHANATATVPQGMAQASPGQSYRTGAPLQAPQPKQAYAFGDLTKGVVDKGKKADGRNEQSGYKFGMCIANRITRYYCLNHSFSCCPILTFVFMQKVILQEVSSNESSHSSTMQSSVESIFHIQYILSAFLIIISNYTF